ncbi:AAA family ATPase [Campylobacter sp. CCS1377]|uniref:AAA family ATPase n=1 Tax=Campylobacter sp. CCS1377 TaxID=3158229 RepID=A0AAU7E796_9BACT
MTDKILKFLEKDHIFLSGGAGVGKSYLTLEVKKTYKNKGKNVVALGSSAISALNICGVTLHSFFALGRCLNFDELMVYDRKQKDKLIKLRKILKKTHLIIIDEISMVSASVFEMIYYRLKNSEFDGKLLVVGDFFQLPPVVKTEDKSLFTQGFYAFDSFAWRDFAFINLGLNNAKRTNNIQFYSHLSALRKGFLDEEIVSYFQNFITQEIGLNNDYTLLCGINKKADLINEQELEKLHSKPIILKSKLIKIDEKLDDFILINWVKSLNVAEELKVKIGAKIIFCINNFDAGYYNGEQGIISDIIEQEDQIYLKIRKSNNQEIILEPYAFALEELNLQEDKIDEQIRAKMIQFPIKLAYAITIHKSQGMSIEKLICDIDNIFENGQLYVALSRAIDPNFLRIFYSKNMDFKLYFKQILKFDIKVLEFYKQTHFLNLEEGII